MCPITVKHHILFDCVLEEKKLDVRLQATSKDAVTTWGKVEKLHRVPKNESAEARAEQEFEVTIAKCKAQEAKVLVSTAAGLAHDLLHQLLLKDAP